MERSVAGGAPSTQDAPPAHALLQKETLGQDEAYAAAGINPDTGPAAAVDGHGVLPAVAG